MLRISIPQIASLVLAASIASAQTTTHHTATATHRPATHTAPKSECVAVPGLSPNIPAVPAGTPCPKSLFTITESAQLSPLLSPTAREAFANLPMTFTLAYQDTRIGTGEPAQPHMWYIVQYTGYLLDGTKFDASADHPGRPFAFPYGAHRVIPGWDMGFEGMRIGGKRRLFVPYQLAYGERGRPPQIPAKSELVFDMELVGQSPTDPNAPPPPPPGAPAPGGPATPPQTPQSTSPQTGPDTKPAPPTPGTPSTPQTPPSTPKQPPPSGI